MGFWGGFSRFVFVGSIRHVRSMRGNRSSDSASCAADIAAFAGSFVAIPGTPAVTIRCRRNSLEIREARYRYERAYLLLRTAKFSKIPLP